MKITEEEKARRPLRVAIAGFGFMGRTHLRAWQAAGAEIVAVCERERSRLHAPPGGNVGAVAPVDLAGVEIFDDIESLLARARPDAISVTLPTDQHLDAAVKALAANVHTVCEKPMARTTAECDRLLDAAEKSQALLLPAHCIRFWPAYVEARDVLQSGRYGVARAAAFRRLSPMPAWSAEGWLAHEHRSGGLALDLHVHDADCVQWWFGRPAEVAANASKDAAGRMVHLSAIYELGGPVVTAEASWAMPPSFGFEMSFTLVLERAVVEFNSRRAPSLTIHPADGPSFAPELAAEDGYTREMAHFARRIRGEAIEPVITPEEARDAVHLVELEREAARRRAWVEVRP